ncbi:ankyrin repeat-containing domain protein [Aspergillus avenaceus]|uniref:Ankyrin repeat-containing domain protein n=1 Tax=Aspergillus avenaceus TaxID=36643 RepID=A0A5N6TTE9_ASPAV|nr:ankyrin repeat-containing domain protein [Aspergillus avenaceus]
MRLLHTTERQTGNFAILEFTDDSIPRYSILSHTWEGGEKKDGYTKLQRCCHLAKAEGFDYVWIDSCSINSMYRWYQEAEMCYVYLADVPSRNSFAESRWFTREWTLQELIVPRKLKFLDEEWTELGSKAELQQAISEYDYLECFISTRVEDRACSLGIFGVNIPLIYGERETAFIRLQEAIMRISDDHSLFAWKSPDSRDSHNIVRFNPFDPFNTPFTATNTGINLKVRFMGIGPRGLGLVILHCKEAGEEDRMIALYVRDSKFLTMERFRRVHSEEFKQLDPRKFRTSQYPMREMSIQAGRLTWHRESKDRRNYDSIPPEIYSDATLVALMDFGASSTLLQAAERGLEDRVWLLLTRTDIDCDQRDPGGQAPLILAIEEGHDTISKILASQRNVNLESRDDGGRTPLRWAAQTGNEPIIKMLVEKSVAIDDSNWKGLTPLAIASSNGHEGTVRVLLQKGAVTESQDKEDRTPLLHAVWKGHGPTVKALLQDSAITEAQDKGDLTPLLNAAWEGYDLIIKALLQNGAVTATKDKEGRTPLICAA